MTSGRVKESRSLFPLRSRWWSAEALAAEVALAETLGLDHGSHGPIEDDDPLVEEAMECGDTG